MNVKVKKIIASNFGVVISLAVAVLACVVYVSMMNTSVAWFSKNKEVAAGGMQIASEHEDVRFNDVIEVERNFEGNITSFNYRRDTDGIFYRRNFDDTDWFYPIGEGGEIISNEKVTFGFSGIMPTETITVTMSFHNYGDNDYVYSLDMLNISGDTFTIGSTEYSILGVYKVGGSFVHDMTAGTVESVNLATGTVNSREDAEVTFTVSVDLTQYSTIEGRTTNVLSEKAMTVGSMRLSFDDGAGA